MSSRWLGILIFLTTALGEAHPVSYKDAVGVMSYNSAEANEFLLTYSLTPRFALAGTYFREAKSEFYVPRLNFLVNRWNNDDSQGNIYFSAGRGFEKFDSRNHDTSLAELIADWESRRYLVAFETQYFQRWNQDNPLLAAKDLIRNKFRLGFAPFLAEYQDLNLWYIAEFGNNNSHPQLQTTQFLRFYMKNVLWEVGAGFDGSFAFNFMIHL